jgi:hypothetical protein
VALTMADKDTVKEGEEKDTTDNRRETKTYLRIKWVTMARQAISCSTAYLTCVRWYKYR